MRKNDFGELVTTITIELDVHPADIEDIKATLEEWYFSHNCGMDGMRITP